MKTLSREKLGRLLLVAGMILLAAVRPVSADEGHDPYEKETGGYRVNMVLEEPVKAGSGEMVIRIQTEQGEPIEGASVQVELERLDEHAAEPEEDHTGEAEEVKTDAHGEAETEKKDDHDEEEQARVGKDEHEKAQAIELKAGHEPGEYHADVDFTRSGEWTVTVHFEVEHVENKVAYTVSVPPGFSKAGVLLGFLGINTAVVVTAVIQKRRSAAERIERSLS